MMRSIISEGGNVFKDIKSDPIQKEDIAPTLKNFFKEIKRVFPNASMHLEKTFTLGSTGKRDVSGDIDLGVDEKCLKHVEDWGITREALREKIATLKKKVGKTAADVAFVKKATLLLIASKIEAETQFKVNTRNVGTGTIFLQIPQYSSEGRTDKFVQCDVDFGNPDWLKFAYYSDKGESENTLKGLHRTELVHALFRTKNLSFSLAVGIKNRDTKELLANNPQGAVDILNNVYRFKKNITVGDMSSYKKLRDFLKDNLSTEELKNIEATYLKILDTKPVDIPTDLQNDWLDRQEELELTGNKLPSSSKLYAFREEE